jgi:prepilin-type processing-associated H-X9-DG protein
LAKEKEISVQDLADADYLVSEKDNILLGDNGVRAVLYNFYETLRRDKFTSRVTVRGKSSAVVNLEVVPENAARKMKPVIVVREYDGWAVNLTDTYAKWNNISRKTALYRIAKMAVVAIPGIPATEEGYVRTCQDRLKQITLGMMQYAQDYDEILPPAQKWNEVTLPYLYSRSSYQCPRAGKTKYGYAMNKKFHRAIIASDDNADETVLVYDSRNLRPNAFGLGGDVAFRHDGGANYAFADGHVKWYPISEPQNFFRKITRERTPEPDESIEQSTAFLFSARKIKHPND